MKYDTDALIRGSTAVTVSIVTAIAAYVSYTHIYHVSHNPLLAFSIDGMIVTSTLVMMAANRAKIERMWLAYVGLWLGILATLAANIAYGYPGGLLSSVWSTWPAVCFVVSVETIAQLSRRKRRVRRKADKPATGEVVIPAQVVKRTQLALANNEPPKPKPVTLNKTPGIKTIRKTLGCGQPVAYEVQAFLKSGRAGTIEEAKQMRDEEKANGNSNNGTV